MLPSSFLQALKGPFELSSMLFFNSSMVFNFASLANFFNLLQFQIMFSSVSFSSGQQCNSPFIISEEMDEAFELAFDTLLHTQEIVLSVRLGFKKKNLSLLSS